MEPFRRRCLKLAVEYLKQLEQSELVNPPKMQSVWRRVLTLPGEYLKQLEQKTGNGRKIEAQIARAYFYVGRMHDRLGEYDQAASKYWEALNKQIVLLKADPRNHALRRDLAETGTRIGLCYFEQPSNKNRARDVVAKALDVLQAVRSERNDQPSVPAPILNELGDPSLNFELAKTYVALAYLDKRIAEEAAGIEPTGGIVRPSARDEYIKAKEILDRLIGMAAASDPLLISYEHRRAHLTLNLANLERDAGHAQDAALSYEAAAVFWSTRLAQPRNIGGDPLTDEADHYAYRDYLATTLRNHLGLETARGKLGEAKKLGEKAVSAAEEFVKEFGYDESRASLARTYLALGFLHLNQRWRAERRGEHDLAKRCLADIEEDGRKASRFSRPSIKRVRKPRQYADGLGRCHLLLAGQFADRQAYATEEQLKSALGHLDKAHQIYKKLTSGRSGNSDNRSMLAMTLRLRGDAQARLSAHFRDQGDTSEADTRQAEADRSYGEACEIVEKLIDPNKPVVNYESQAGQHFCHRARFMNEAQTLKRGDKELEFTEQAPKRLL